MNQKVQPLSSLLTFDITFVFYDGIAINREWPTLRRCDGEQRRNNDAPIDDPDVISVDKKSTDPRTLTSRRQDRHPIDTDKLNVSLYYLYFISLNFIVF